MKIEEYRFILIDENDKPINIDYNSGAKYYSVMALSQAKFFENKELAIEYKNLYNLNLRVKSVRITIIDP